MTPTASAPDPSVLSTLPRVFIDRSLGAIQVPAGLRNAGVDLVTMREHYGERAGQEVLDPDWIGLISEHGWIGFHKDAAIHRNDIEKDAVVRHRARLFCVPRADLKADQLIERYLSNLVDIAAAAQRPGPFIYGVYPNQIRRLPLG